MFKKVTWSLAAISLLALTTLATAGSKTGKFSWTTDSDEAIELIEKIQSRVENFQLGSGTLELSRKLVAADPSFAMGSYYLSAVVPPPEQQEALAKAIELAADASEGERRFIEAMAAARGVNGAQLADAIPLLESLQQDYPNERLVPMILGQIHQNTGNVDKARSYFNRALEIGPPSNRARSFLANDDLLREAYADARRTFESIAKELPKDAAGAAVRYGIAFSHLYQGNDEAAVAALETFLTEYRDSGAAVGFPEVFIWNSIARIHLEHGRPDEAMKAYEMGYQSVPNSSLPEDQKRIWYGRLKHGTSRTLAKLGRMDEAWELANELRGMIDAGGENGAQFLPAYHYLAGYLKLEEGDAKTAAEHLEQANPNDPFHTLLLARARTKIGDEDGANEAYRSIVESTNNGLERALAYPEAKAKLAI